LGNTPLEPIEINFYQYNKLAKEEIE